MKKDKYDVTYDFTYYEPDINLITPKHMPPKIDWLEIMVWTIYYTFVAVVGFAYFTIFY